MKAWLGAAAAVSGVGTLVYLLARSGRRRDTGHSGTASGTHTGQKATSEGSGVSRGLQDTGFEKDGSHDHLNGHLPGMGVTREAVKQSATDPAEQNSHENLLLSKDTCTRELALNVAENNAECVSVAQNKVDTEASPCVESEETTQEVRVTEAVTEKTSDSVPLQHPQEQNSGVTDQQKDTETQQKDAETREDRGDDVVLPCTDVEESNTVASGETELTNVTTSADETMCSDTNITTLSGTTCHSELTETTVREVSDTQPNKASCASAESESSPTAPQPVVEELSQCLIVKPQCDPSCHEHMLDTCCASSPQVSTLPPSETTEASLTETEGAIPETNFPALQQYTLVLKSEEDICISGKHIHDSSPTDQPTEAPAGRPKETAEANKEEHVTTVEGSKEDPVTTAEVNKEEPVTCTVVTEQTDVVDLNQPSVNPCTPIEEKCTLKESVLVSCEGIGDERKEIGANSEAAAGETNNTVGSTPQKPSRKVECSVETQIIVTPAQGEELTDSKEEENQNQDSDTKQEGETEKKVQVSSKEDKQEKLEQSGDKVNLKREQDTSKRDKVTKEEVVTIEQEKSNTKEKITKKEEENIIIQEKTKKQKQTSNVKEVGKEQKHSNKKQESPKEQRQSSRKQEAGKEQRQSSRRQEAPKEQRQGNRRQEQSDKQEKSKKQEETGSKEDRSGSQESTKRREQSVEKQDVQVSGKSVKELVMEEQIVTLSTKGDGGKKGSVRSRGDSASADLDCDLGSEQDNMNCDSSSLKSMDSGQGSSEIEPETLFGPANFPVSNQEQYIFYDFEIPQMLVGRLIGRKGAFINKIKATTDATVIVHPHKNRKLKLCSVEGTKHQVNAALEMIRKHFPESQYPDITLQQVSSQPQAQPQVQPQVNAQSMQIELTAGVVVEVRVSAVVSGGELWVQQPLHPSYSALHRLQTCMNLNYGDGSNTPPLPGPISDGTVCVAHINDHWMRCQVLSSINAMSVVLLLDIGGTVTVPSSSLRQIRYDYMTLPFQASQCFLHGVQPVTGDMWSDAASAAMEEWASGVILFAVVVSYTEDYVPLINLYRRDQDQFVLLNKKLVELDLAQWISPQHSS
uniref:Tudor domain-containing protein n=1 Tax=Scylla olivacea TaxID=85551 RepID=A0A0P4W2W9_SCYOL